MERPLNDKSQANTFLVVATLLCLGQAGDRPAVTRAKSTALCSLSEAGLFQSRQGWPTSDIYYF